MKPKSRAEALTYILPALLIYILVVLVPILWSIGYSFFDWNGIGDMKFIGLNNYKKLFSDDVFHAAFVNNLIFMVISTVFQLIVGLGLATLLTRIAHGRAFLRVVYFIPCIISSMAICQIFKRLLSIQPVGLVNFVLDKLGLEQIAFIADPNISLITLTLIDGYKFCGIYMIIFFSALVSVPRDVVEAAHIDGCNGIKSYFYVELPMIKDIFCIVVVMLVNGCLKTFDIFYIMDNRSLTTEMVATYMYKTAFSSSNFGYGSALSVFLVVECLIAVVLIQRLFPKSEIE